MIRVLRCIFVLVSLGVGTPLLAADLIFEGGGERMIVAGDRIPDIALTTDHMGGPAVQFRLSKEDGADFHQLTRKLVGQEMAVIVCDEVLIRPRVMQPLSGGAGLITMPSREAALLLIERLRGEAPCEGPLGS